MLKLSSIFIYSEEPRRLADFYQAVFQKDPSMDDGGYVGFMVGETFLFFGPHDKVHGSSTQPERILLNFETNEVEAEFERITKLGAQVIAKPYHPMEDESVWIATLADPDGNYFQINTPWEETK